MPNVTGTTPVPEDPNAVKYDDITWFGIALAIVSNAFISTSLNVQKWAHNKNEALGEARKPYTQLRKCPRLNFLKLSLYRSDPQSS